MVVNLNVKTDNMKTILKIIGAVLWVISGMMLTIALALNYKAGFQGNQNAFTFLVWVFLIVFVCYTPLYLGTIFSNTMYMREDEIRSLRVTLHNRNREAIKVKRDYGTRLLEFGEKIHMLNIDNLVKTKEEKMKEVDTLFNNVPLDDTTQLLRDRVLTYIRENG